MILRFLKIFKSKKLFFYLLVVVLCLPLLYINLRDSHDWGDDFAQYIHQAKNIIEGVSQSNTAYVYSPNNAVIGPPAYLIGFPLILSPVYYLFENNIMAFLTLINICLIILAVFIYRFYAKYFSVIASLLLVLIFTYNPWLLNFKAEIMSEIPFTLLLFIILELYNKIEGIKSVFWQVITGLLIGFLISIRPTGAVFILAISVVTVKAFINNIRNKQKKMAWNTVIYNSISIITAIFFFFFLNRILFQIPSGAVSSYAHIFNFGSLIKTMSQNLAFYFEVVKYFFLTDNYYLKFASVFMQSAFLVFAVGGWVKKTFIKATFIEIFVLIYLIVILVYPYSIAGLRFLLPILPFLLYYAALTAKELLAPINLKYKKILIILMGIIVLMQYRISIINIINSQHNIVWGPQYDKSAEAFNFIKNNLPENAVIEFEKPRALSLYTGRNGFHVNNTLPIDAIKSDFEKAGVSYILDVNEPIEEYTVNTLKIYIKRNSKYLKRIWANSKFKLYKIGEASDQSFEEFNGLTDKTPAFQSIITYDTVNTEFWQNVHPTSEVFFNGAKSGRLSKDMLYGLTYKTRELPAITQANRVLLFRSYFLHDTISDCDIVVSINENDKNAYYKSYNLKDILKLKNKWEKVELLFELPKVNAEHYEFSVYIWNKGKNNLFVDDFEFKIY